MMLMLMLMLISVSYKKTRNSVLKVDCTNKEMAPSAGQTAPSLRMPSVTTIGKPGLGNLVFFSLKKERQG